MALRPHQYRGKPIGTTNFKHLVAQHLLCTNSINHIHDKLGNRLNVDKLLLWKPTIWKLSVSNELGRLTQGISNIKGNDVMDLIPKFEIL